MICPTLIGLSFADVRQQTSRDTMHCCVSMALGARFVCVVPDCATLSEWLQHELDLSHRIVLKNRLFCVCCAMMMQLRLQLMIICAKAYMPLSLL